jgi:hypothetical protein
MGPILDGKGVIQMTTYKDPKSSTLSANAAYVLWACAFDDDDLAGYLLDYFVLYGATKWLAETGPDLSTARRKRLERVGRELRIHCLRAEEEVADRVTSYVRAELQDEIPF